MAVGKCPSTLVPCVPTGNFVESYTGGSIVTLLISSSFFNDSNSRPFSPIMKSSLVTILFPQLLAFPEVAARDSH